MSSLIGEQVILKKSLMTGVVVGQGEKGSNYYVVKYWDTDAKKYNDVEEHVLHIEIIKNPLLFKLENTDDKEGMNAAYDLMTDMALDAGDRKWFESIGAARKRLKNRRPVEMSILENNRIRLGRMVVDNNGTNAGIVIHENTHQKNTFLVWCWSTAVSDYVKLKKHASSLKVVQSPSWNEKVNKMDKVGKESTLQAFIDIAIMTDDYEWLKELTKNEISETDGA